jgi:tRNA(Ile2) C34 agmatinyltransferase TiaS
MLKTVVEQQTLTDRCHRCGGIMQEEEVFEIGSSDWHCLSCGDRIDRVILAHRRESLTRIEAENIIARQGKSRLN